MQEKTIVLNAMDEEDVERAVSEMAGRSVKLEEMDISVIDCMPLSDVWNGDYSNCELRIEVSVDGEELYDEDYDSPLDGFVFKHPVCIGEDIIFNFPVSKFKSYERHQDSSD